MWEEVGSNTKCDADAGEAYQSQPSGKVADIAACQKSCENDADCNSITFFTDGFCSHFSTGCTKTKADGNAISLRLGTATGGPVVLNALTVKTCNFACKEGYYRTKGGTNIAFTCAHNGGVTNAKGNDNWDTIGKCEGA